MSRNSKRRSPAEKASLIISLFIVSLVVALICYTWISGDNNPPQLALKTFQLRQVDRQYYVPFSVTNLGGTTANSVEVVAKLTTESEVQTGRQQFDFLSRQESQSGEFIFDRSPDEGELIIRVASYQEP